MKKCLFECTIGGILDAARRDELIEVIVSSGLSLTRQGSEPGTIAQAAQLKEVIDGDPPRALTLYSSKPIINTPFHETCRRMGLASRILSLDQGTSPREHWITMSLPVTIAPRGPDGVRRGLDLVFSANEHGMPVMSAEDLEVCAAGVMDLSDLLDQMKIASSAGHIPPLGTSGSRYFIQAIDTVEQAASYQRIAPVHDVVPTWRTVRAHGGTLYEIQEQVFGQEGKGRPVGMFSLRDDGFGREHIAVEVGIGHLPLRDVDLAAIAGFIHDRAEGARFAAEPSGKPGAHAPGLGF